jgi:hypothetical protein
MQTTLRKRLIVRKTVLAAVLVATAMGARAQKSVAPSGDGTPANPYQIARLEHLAWMGKHVGESAGKHYRLMSDLDAAETVSWNEGLGHEPIGDSWNCAFAGVFDGDGYAIRNLTVNAPRYANDVGLFGAVGAGGAVQNLELSGALFVGGNCVGAIAGENNGGVIRGCRVSAGVDGLNEVGGLVGRNQAGTIEACEAACEIRGNDGVGGLAGFNTGNLAQCHATGKVGGVFEVGGLVGHTESGVVSECSAAGSVTGIEGGARGTAEFGGLAGMGSGLIERCFATGDVTGDFEVGGLIGYSFATVRQCFATGAVAGDEHVGGLIGREEGGVILLESGKMYVTALSECYATGRVKSLFSCSDHGLVGNPGLRYTAACWDTETSGQNDSEGVFGKTTAQMKRQASFAGWDFDAAWAVEEKLSYPFLRAAGPLFRLKTGVRGPGRVTVTPQKDFYAPGEKATLTALADDGPYLFAGWVGGAADEDAAATTVTMDSHKSVTAVFVKVKNISSIQELQKIGNDVNYPLTGNYQLTQDLDATCTVDWNDGAGFAPICASGYFSGLFEGNGHVIRGLHIDLPRQNQVGLFRVVYYKGVVRHLGLVGGSVRGAGSVGGIVGINAQGRVKGCYVATDVAGAETVGGVAGLNSGAIEKSYATGRVAGARAVGGVAGNNYYFCGRVGGCYAAGPVSGAKAVGGLVGDNPENQGSTTRSYWDVEASRCAVSKGGEGKTSAQMKRRATFADWDFTTDWGIEEGREYPYLLQFRLVPQAAAR